ncbi:hypothetical protein KY285_016451 [Solanum tuberosum]|nr:hypothetical protein KY284_016449 [Solanum tuberosum]KAH0685897.1 hypothetical protein KY284_016450 [Solanum tuberosum]KAH0685898.1 hypothetical protein KY284_016451 [Solanum tuberosum]KAH0702171.1 hypothetical protein KY285_016449 [Solanum tuberosum]KAH0702173.1 hypothetical protein KY285_016451 [Solanum tuberosum]
MVARTEKANMEAAPVGMEAARPSFAAARPSSAVARPPLLLRWWRRSGMGGDGRRWGWVGGGE